jgi:hypothetical protein
MSKFLRLVQENQPGEDKYTVELKDSSGKIKRHIAIFGVDRAIFENFLVFEESVHGKEIPIPVEDQEEELTTNKAIEDEAAMDPNGLAGKAVQRRKEKVERAVKDYEQQTLGL